jgi:antitoxin component YwqK of YwqJK toxin-antitoxin module
MNTRSPLYDNGLLRFNGEFLDGEMHGYWEFYRKDGSIMRSGTFDHGAQVDTWKTFDRDGKLVKETKFQNPQ